MVTCPGIIALYLVEMYTVHLLLIQMVFQQELDTSHVGCSYKQMLIAGNDVCQFQISLAYLWQVGLPIGARMWPCQHDGTLWLPFCWECEIARQCGLIHKLYFLVKFQAWLFGLGFLSVFFVISNMFAKLIKNLQLPSIFVEYFMQKQKFLLKKIKGSME